MSLRRALVLLLPLAAIGCAGTAHPPPAPLAQRFGLALEAADPQADTLILRMDAFEHLAMREDAAIAFASGGRQAGPPRLLPAGSGAADAAGQVLMPALTALGDYAHGLAQLAGGGEIEPRGGPAGALLARDAEKGLQAVRATSGTAVPEAVRSVGLAGITALSDLPDRIAATPGATVQAMLQEAAPHVAAVTGLMRAVIGAQPGEGTRGALRARREGLDALHARFLASVAADHRLGPGERYAIFRSVAALREEDPAQGSFAALAAVLDGLEAAQAALVAGGPDAEEKVAAFEAAVARLGALAEASRRG
ncbi:hypothetical protein [Paracraurococcus lichenis]|uniref:Uncharacterized protein n=1 Tax=Paracraurococcus lichenis TaxID=3064888 RepID=A0ABT9DX34_9PROT|nr:hypothetical protein [Paracraurococcus sp. LOR1-02]MDO9708459.1 hypothetical protein [Paracraurococcus sp. LOR1-02]